MIKLDIHSEISEALTHGKKIILRGNNEEKYYKTLQRGGETRRIYSEISEA